MIHRVRLRDFKCIEDLELYELGEITVFVGPNGSGKTAILEAMRSVATKGGDGNHDVDGSIDSATLLRLNPDKLAEPSCEQPDPPRLHSDGAGLPSLLRNMQAKQPAVFEQTIDALRSIFPSIQQVRTRRVPSGKAGIRDAGRGSSPHEVVFDTTRASDLPATDVSGGMLRVLAILAVAAGEKRPDMVLLDNIDNSLHPTTAERLIAELRYRPDEKSTIQILATAHSPYLVDHLEPGEVWLTDLDRDGCTVVRRLDEHPEYERWADEMSLGEFWSYVGEQWVAGKSEE